MNYSDSCQTDTSDALMDAISVESHHDIGGSLPAVERAIRFRQHLKGYMSDYHTALAIVRRANQSGEQPNPKAVPAQFEKRFRLGYLEAPAPNRHFVLARTVDFGPCRTFSVNLRAAESLRWFYLPPHSGLRNAIQLLSTGSPA